MDKWNAQTIEFWEDMSIWLKVNEKTGAGVTNDRLHSASSFTHFQMGIFSLVISDPL